MKPLVIGVGNLARGDDGIGIEVARELAAKCSDVADFAESIGDPTRLMDLWAGRKSVNIIDAVTLKGKSPGEWFLLEPAKEGIPKGMFHTSTHAFGITEALEFGKIFGNLPNEVNLWLICANQFDPLSKIQPAVTAAGEELKQKLANHLNRSPA